MGTKQDEPLGAGQKKLVQDSYAMVAPIAETAAELFYNKLFEFDPSLEALFKTDIKDQGRKLMATLRVRSGDDQDYRVPSEHESNGTASLDEGERGG